MFYLYKPINNKRNGDCVRSIILELSCIILSDLRATCTGFSVAKATVKLAVK